MNLEPLKTELALSVDAALESDDQLRQLSGLIDKASKPNASISPADCAKLVAAVLSVNARLHEQCQRNKQALHIATTQAAKGRDA